MQKVISSKKTLLIIGLMFFLLIFTVVNGVINILMKVVTNVFNTEDVLNPPPLNIDLSTFFGFHLPSLAFYGAVALLALVGSSVMVYKIRSNFASLEKGQKGTSKFTTLDELKKQYRSVPEKKEEFDGGGGVPISRYKNKIFIDDSPVNNLWIGTTRSGKGEMGIFPTIDIYSRAKEKASMVLNDPKGELYAASKETLEKRGYHVEVLNLMRPMESMSYQILQLVIDAYKQEDFSNAQQLAQSISYMLYYDPQAKDKFWQESSISLCNALILAVCEKCIKENKEDQITMYSVANMLTTLGTKKIKDQKTGMEIDALDDYFSKLPADNVAKMQYATLNFSSGVTRAGILANTSAKLGIFTLDGVAKMTSKNSFDLKKIGFGRLVVGSASPLKRVKMIFPNGEVESIKTDIKGRFEINFTNKIKEGDSVTFEEQGNDSKLIVTIEKINENNGEITFSTSQECKSITLKKFEYFSKPTAVFMITPDYDASLHVIASLYVKQLYTELSKTASQVKSGKCLREVIFLLDEFGNMPAISDMGSIITVCLGRRIRFNLVIQAYSQLKEKYGDSWETIDGNCGNTIYILTTDDATAEKIATKLGEKDITTKSRSGGTLSLDKNKTESVDARKLLNANELMQLQEGEMVVIRIIKRQDKKRQRITPRPIFNTGETAMKYRWEYLADDFNTDKSINDIDIPCLHADVDLQKLVIDFDDKSVREDKKEDNAALSVDTEAKPKSEAKPKPEPESKSKVKQESKPTPTPPPVTNNESNVQTLVKEKVETVDEEKESPIEWKGMNVQTFFNNDKTLLIIERSLTKHPHLNIEDIRELNIIDFMDLLENMVTQNVLPNNIYSSFKGKYKRLVAQYEGGD